MTFYTIEYEFKIPHSGEIFMFEADDVDDAESKALSDIRATEGDGIVDLEITSIREVTTNGNN